MKNKLINPIDQDKRIKAEKAIYFLRCHPAFRNDVMGDSIFEGANFSMASCCKRGICESGKDMLTVYHGDKGWKNLESRFDKKYADSETPKLMQSVYASYLEVYGEPWVFDHVEYWYETTFFVYEGDPYNYKECHDYKKWGGYSGPSGGELTFEDMMIKWAAKVKRVFGNFNIDDDFYTQTEIDNHKTQISFVKVKKNNGYYLKENPNHLIVTKGMKNLRWLKWFIRTDYCKKNWSSNISDFEERINNLEKMPAKRKKLLEKYT